MLAFLFKFGKNNNTIKGKLHKKVAHLKIL